MTLKIIFRTLVYITTLVIFIGCGGALTPVSLVTPDPGATSPDFGVTPNYYPHLENWKDPVNHGQAYRDTIKNGQSPEKSLCVICHNFRKDSPACSTCHAIYPHEYNWGVAVKHGTYVSANGKDSCATQCHGTDLKSGLSGISCQSCHHPEKWAAPENHGVFVLKNEKESCRKCHGEDLQGGVTGSSCYNSSCHATYPHTQEWSAGEAHGIFALSKGKEDCRKCHGDDLSGGISKISCSSASCHSTYPHIPDWNKPENHGAFVLQNNKDECKKCHGNDLKGGISDITCFNSNCHSTYPHSEAWSEGINHGMLVLSTGKEDCKKCHGDDLSGGISKISCSTASCHATYPHPAGWKTKENHGAYTVSNGKEECQKCHGDNFEGGISGQSCTSCHADYPHMAGWELGGGHGKTFSNKYNATSADATCWNCHAQPVVFEANHTKQTLAQQSLCYSCHSTYPHIGAVVGDAQDIYDWEPVINPEYCTPAPYGLIKMENIGHLFFFLYDDTALFADADGNHPSFNSNPPTPSNSPLWANAVAATCGGGTEGSCHKDGYRTYKTGVHAAVCSGYCHKNTQPLPPAPPPCPAP